MSQRLYDRNQQQYSRQRLTAIKLLHEGQRLFIGEWAYLQRESG